MDNPRFIDDETIPLVQDEDYDDYITPNTSRVDKTSFTEPDATETTSTLQLRQKVKLDKITALYRHLNVTGDPGLANIDQFMIKKKENSKTGNTDLLFLSGYEHWQSLTNKRIGEFLAASTLRDKKFGRLNIMKRALGLDEAPPALERSFKAVTKLKLELPTDIEMRWKVYLWRSLRLWCKIFMLRHEKHHKILTLTCQNFQVFIRSYKAYGVNSEITPQS